MDQSNTVWGINKRAKDKPDMVLFNGDVTVSGAGGNHHYTFKNGRYSYILHVTIIGCYYLTAGWL
ncbi:hypothetical protein [Pseudoalteromonas sp. B62]|uniref:hypothetical protein n=1 Tax=Pseudoalteromonas sp. B62 TaxID=630483 RepID=UPI0012FE0120